MDLDERQLAALLLREYQAADKYRQELDRVRVLTNDYYDAKPFGNEMDGMSQVVLPDVQEVIDYMSASVLRTFLSGDRVVEFEAQDEGFEDAADDATEAVNYSFMRLQDGYRVLHDATKDGLINKIGVFKTVVETEEYVTREQVIADPLQIEEVAQQHGLDIEDMADNGDGTVTASIKREKVKKCFRDYAVPPWQFLFSPNARHEDAADYLCHEEPKTRSDLVEMGFDAEQVYALPAHSRFADQQNPTDDGRLWESAESSRALELALLCEEYVRIDIDGDGIAERVKVFRVDTEILRHADGSPTLETVEDHPFSVFCPFPRQHRVAGDSLAEKVMDIQLVRSEVARQLLNGLAFGNMPRPVVDTAVVETETLDDILSPIPGAPIRARGGAASVSPFQTGFDIQKSLGAMEWITGERESRTGITRLNQGLDADALNKTATGTALMQAAGQQQEEYVARNLAEALARLFVKKYKLMRAEAEPFTIRVDGEARQVDPSQWPDDINIVVRTGLGSGSKDRRIQARMMLAPVMTELVQGGFTGRGGVFNWLDGVVRDMGIGKGADYMDAPDSPEAQAKDAQPQPDPEMMKVQQKAQSDGAKLQLQGQLGAAQIQQKHDAAMSQIAQKQEADNLKAMQEQERLHAEAVLEMRRQDLEAETKRHIAGNRAGGELDR